MTASSTPGDPGSPAQAASGEAGETDAPSREELEAELAAMRDRLAETPASAVVANHCVALFDLARVYLSLKPPKLDQAAVAIDALAALVRGLEGRLGADETFLRDGLWQLQQAFLAIQTAVPAGDGHGTGPPVDAAAPSGEAADGEPPPPDPT